MKTKEQILKELKEWRDSCLKQMAAFQNVSDEVNQVISCKDIAKCYQNQFELLRDAIELIENPVD